MALFVVTECTNETYQCENHLCTSASKTDVFCNGVVECSDGSDESANCSECKLSLCWKNAVVYYSIYILYIVLLNYFGLLQWPTGWVIKPCV